MTLSQPTTTDTEMDQGPAISMMAQGMPIGRTLHAIARVAGHLQEGWRSAILLPDEDRFVLAAESDLHEDDRALLTRIPGGVSQMIEFGRANNAEVRPLLTQAAELVGVIAIFNFKSSGAFPHLLIQMDEVCAIATLAVEQKNLSEELSYRSNHDPLTHLWNRSWMEDQLGVSMEAASRTGEMTGLILLGIDAFRLFNELLGRQAGDQLLRLIAGRLSEALEPGSFLARNESDEFAILMPHLQSESRVSSFASQLRSWFDKPFLIEDHELIVRASLGTATAGPGEYQASDLQNRADQALQYAKRYARGRISAFSAEMMKTPLERLVMERHLRFALQKREFELHYQPQVNLLTGQLLGVEALLRWKHPSLGFISPMTFVPIAEEIGLIEEIGEWVLAEALRQLEAWYEAGLPHIRMAVNVSACQFGNKDFACTVAKRLRGTKIDPQFLELEITETAVMTDLKHGARQMALLRGLGVQTALDDFGTGHSSLAYLKNLPIDRLKIDRMFVKDIAASDEPSPLLSSIIQMGLSLGCKVIAEGIETVEQALALSRMQCEEAQGYLFSKPLPPWDLFRWATARAGTNQHA
jgi:diguanylate cyclase (GGDEF)-like protein